MSGSYTYKLIPPDLTKFANVLNMTLMQIQIASNSSGCVGPTLH